MDITAEFFADRQTQRFHKQTQLVPCRALRLNSIALVSCKLGSFV
jgi:hypothetical protein